MPYKNEVKKQAYFVKKALRKRGEYKTCTLCGESKHESEFIKWLSSTRQKMRRAAFCHPCRKQYLRDRDRARKYGLSAKEYKQKLETQQGKCAICLKDMILKGKKICIDHNHTTGQVRDLLCVQCNSLLGNAKEDFSILKSAITYLHKYNNLS